MTSPPRDATELASAKRLGADIKRLRLSRGIRQVIMAGALDIIPSKLAHIEAGRIRPSPKLVTRIAEILGVHPVVLMQPAGWCIHCGGTGRAGRDR